MLWSWAIAMGSSMTLFAVNFTPIPNPAKIAWGVVIVPGFGSLLGLPRSRFLLRSQCMTPSPEDLAAQYAQMSETELMELARSYDGLVETAQVALRAEFARRGLEPPLVEEPEEWELRRLVTVLRYRDLTEALVGRSLLESAGIPAWIADEHLVRMDWFYSNLVGGMRLQVDERDEAAAREILEQAAPETITYGEEEVYVQPTCPKCGSAEITLGSGTERGRSFLALYVLAIPVPPREAAWHCEACGARWSDAENGEPLE
jgi:predicted RNA-binding Zn-ribbon protein involved in translation (DUF1610 family)